MIEEADEGVGCGSGDPPHQVAARLFARLGYVASPGMRVKLAWPVTDEPMTHIGARHRLKRDVVVGDALAVFFLRGGR